MYQSMTKILLVSLSATGVLSDFLGPTFPYPRDIAGDNSLVYHAWNNVTSTLDTYLESPTIDLTGPSGLQNLTFSVGMFSLYDECAAKSLQFHHTSAEVTNSTTGTTQADANSIYRVASVTKLITAFAGMIELDSKDWDRPITDFVPSLATYAAQHPGEIDPVNTIQWDRVTLAALGAQIAGTPRDVNPYDPGDDYYQLPNAVELYGLPPLELTDPVAIPACVQLLLANKTCSNNIYASGAEARPPVFLPWTSPSYTDFGFMLLGIAIANITGKPIESVYQESIFRPLSMASSTSIPPVRSGWKNLIIPGDVANADLMAAEAAEVTRPSGGVFSTINDLNKLGIALLNSTLLPSDQMRKWMKQISHTASLENSIGRPWEIYRYQHPGSGIITDIYTKWGDSGSYGGYLILIPDFGVGFSILGASSLAERSVVTTILADTVTETILPALMAQAQSEAGHNYAGTYTSTRANVTTTLTLALNETEGAKPGLVITSFISNGTDVLKAEAIGQSPIRLLPSIPDDGTGEIAFRASPYREAKGGMFQRQLNVNIDWLTGDSGTYGGFALGLFVFDLDEAGKAVAVTPKAWRVKLQKQF